MDKYLEAEKRLAELLGWKCVQLGGSLDGLSMPENWLHGIWPIDGEGGLVPQWCRDWSACGPLMVEHGVWPFIQPDGYVDTFISGMEPDPDIDTPLSDHPDRETAVRYAIVQAVIAKLESNNV